MQGYIFLYKKLPRYLQRLLTSNVCDNFSQSSLELYSVWKPKYEHNNRHINHQEPVKSSLASRLRVPDSVKAHNYIQWMTFTQTKLDGRQTNKIESLVSELSSKEGIFSNPTDA